MKVNDMVWTLKINVTVASQRANECWANVEGNLQRGIKISEAQAFRKKRK